MYKLLIFVVIACVGSAFSPEFSLDQIDKMFDGLRDLSAVVFGVCGIWAGVVFPEAVKITMIHDKDQIDKNLSEYKKVLHPLISTCIVLIGASLPIAIVPLVGKIVVHDESLALAKLIMTGYLYFLLCILLFSFKNIFIMSLEIYILADRRRRIAQKAQNAMPVDEE